MIYEIFKLDGEVCIFNDALFPGSDLNGGKVKDGADAAFLKKMGNPLRLVGWGCDEADLKKIQGSGLNILSAALPIFLQSKI